MSSGSGNASLHCSMSSSADFSDEDDYSLKSGSVSPAPGDTLPWNLPRHERHKRQIQGGSVLDPAERAVLRIADERDRVQKKTFTKWINQHLLKVRKHVNDLYEDLRDGHNLISLLEVLTGQSLPREKGRMRFHRLQNVQIALDFLKRRQVKLVNIRNDDITDGNPKLTLGLIWTIILHFQISEIHVCGESEDMTAKERLLMWSQQMTEGYVGVRCDNFTSSWRDGRLFNAIIHKYRPDLVDMARVSAQTSRSNLEQAFGVAERLGVARLLDPEDVDVQTPDEKSVITYVSTLYDVFPKVPDGVDGINANDVDIKWVEYQNMVNYLSQWLKHNVAVMSDRAFPNNPVELKALYTQYLQFKENEIPLKETEKSKIKHLYKMLEVWIEFGRIQLPQGYHPNDVEKEWGKLIVAMLEREKSLRPEVDRLEMLQQIASRVQRDCVNGEDKLELARAALQSDAKRLESGVQFQNEAETAGYLLECENLLRQQVVDIQILLDGKYYYSDQLVQRVSKLRDDLLGLRAECSSVYRQGRTLTPQQTTMMISGITQSLNSGFSSSNLNSSLTPGGLGTPGSTFTSILTPGLTPALSPAMTPGGMQPGSVQAYMGGGGVGMAPGDLQHLKHMQIRKPLCKTSLADPNMTEDEVNINFVQDLINWVEEMQVQLDRGDWGSDLPSVETHLENHKGVHRAIEEFQMSLKEAKLSETQMNQKLSYSEKLGKLETQYGKLLNCSRERQKNLESLHDFVSRATMELIWLNEKEEEEVAFDWSDLNGNISKKRQYHSDLMRELDEKEEVIKSVQDRAENLLQENHPARLTLEAYKAAMQTQWSWILQLCSCVEQHLKDNTVYFEFLNNAKESTDYLKSLQGDIQRKYGCDRTSSVHKLEDHIQESMDEKEQLLQYRSTVAGLVGKAKAIVQLKPRNPDTPVRSSIPVKAICDYRQIEITIYKDDECVLASNSHRAKWKVISPSGNEAMVPSVCFTVPPPNKEAVDQASRIEQLYQNVLALWHHSHIKMKSVVSWHYLMADVRAVRDWNVSSIKTMLPGEHQQVLSNLQSHFEDFLEDSKESEVFTVADCSQLEREVLACKDYYEELLKSAEREEHEESVYNLYISEVRNFRMRLEAQEEHLIRQIRTPLDRDDLEQSVLRITEQEKKKAELDQLKDDLETMKEKCETFFRQAGASPAVPTLSSDLNVLIHSMSQVYSMSAIYLEKLKTVSMVVRHSQSAEALVKLYEAKLSEEDAVNSDLKSIDTVVSTLKQWRSEIDEQREIFHDLEDGLQKARGISERMFKAHNERDFDLDWHKEKADQLEERWSNVHSQIESRLRDLEGISKSLKYYKDSYGSLDEWVREMEAAQLKTQEKQPEDSKALAELVNQQKLLVAEMEQKQSRIDECQKYSEQYSSGAKDYELQLLTYRAMVDSQHKSPLKRRRMQNSADAIIQEFMDLRTRYTAVVTSMTQYVKFASETLKRAEGEENRKASERTEYLTWTESQKSAGEEVIGQLQQQRSVDEEKKEHGDKVSKLLNWMSSVKPGQNKDGKASTEASSKPQVSMEEMVTQKEKIAEALRTTQLMLSKHSDKMTEEEKLEAKEQLKSLHQAYSDLTQQCSDQTPSAEQEFQTIEGVLEVGSIEVYSVFSSVQSGMIDHTTGLSLLEAQLITSGLVLPQFRMCLELDEAFHHNLIDEATWKQLRELNEANRSILSPPFSSEPLPVMAALREGAVSERLAMKVIEIQLATGGLRVSYTGDVLTLERAFQFGLIPAPLYVKLLERQNTWKDLINPGTAEKVSLTQLVQRSVVDEETGLRLLPVKKSHNGSIELTSGREMSVLRAVHEGLIDRETTLRLLGAQLFAGGIADPKTGRKLTVEQALSEGLIDQDTASGILSQQAQNGGIVNPQNGKRLTVDEAVQCDLMSFSSALLVLEKQKGLMGLLWPHSGEILTVSTSLRHEIITSQLAFKLLSNRQKIASLYIPEYSEVVDINSATQNGLIDVHTAEVLKTIEIPDVFPDVDDLNDRFSNWLMLRELQIGGSHRSTDDNEIDYENINTPSSIEAKQLFISYLTMNSYMDPKSGQRLLIFDGQLTKMAELLVDISVETTENQVYNTGPGNAPFEDISLKEDISEDSEMSFDSNTEDFGYLHINEETDGTMKDHHASNFFKEEESAYKQSDNQAFSNNVVKVVAHDGTEDFPSAIDCVNNTTLPDSDISIYQKNTSSIPIGIDVESSDNQSNETFTGSSATQTPSTDMSLPSGALDCKMMIAHDFTEKFHSSVKNTRQHNSVSSDGPSPFEIGLETSDKALYNQSIGESATHAMSESSTRTKSCSVSGKDISLLAQRVTDEASVAVHSEKNARQPDSKDNVLSNSTYQKTRHSTNPSSFEIGVETSEIPSDYQSQETVNGVSASETVLESSAPPRLCFVNDTDMRLTSGAKDSKKVVAKGLTEEASVEVSSCKNTRTSPALTEIDLVTSETYSDNQPKDTANGVSATQTILESSTPRFCTVDSKKTIQQSDSEAIVSKKKKINNTSIVPFEINVETSHITSDNQPQEAFTFNEGSATQIILERSTHPLLCSVNDADRSFPSAAPDSKRMPAQKEYSSSENNAQHSKMEVAHGFRDESPISIDSEKNTRQPSFEMGVLSDRIYQTNTMSTSPTPFKMDSETDIASDNQPKGTFNGSSATQTVLKSSTLCSRKDTGLPLASVAQGSPQRPTYPVTPGCETDKDTNFESSLLATVLTDTLDTTTAFPCTEEVVWDNTDERGLATHLLRPQVEEGGILYIISEKRCDLDSPFDKGLVDEETVLEVSALQLHKGDVLEEERSTVATLKEVVSESSISSQIALQTMEQHSMLGGVHDPKSGCTISVSAALDSAMIDDDLAEKILHSDPVHKAIIHPDRHCTHSMSYSQSLGLIDNDEAENLRQHQTDKKLSVLVLDDSDEEEWIENTDGHAREDLYTEGSKEQNCDSQKALLPSFTISHGPVCRQIISPILSDQVTEGRVIHELETTSSFREDSASHSPTSPLSDIVPGSRNSIQNDILSNRSNSLSLSDSGDSGAPQRQAEELRQTEEDGSSSLRRDTDLSCEAVGFTPGDGQLGAGYREIVGDQTVSPVQSDSGVSCSSHSDLLSDERKMENTVQAPASQLVKESDRRIDSSSPRDLSGDVTSTVSGDVGVSGDKTVINGDGVSSFNTVSPQRPLVKSERDVGGEIELTSSQNGHSHSKPTVQKKTPVQLTNLSDLAIVSSVHSIKSGNDNKDSYDIGDQEQLETAPIKEISSTITPDPTLTDKRLPNSNANVEAKANDRVESSRSGDSKPGRQEGSSDDGLSQITDQATSQTGQTSSNDTSLLSASTMTPGNPSKAKEPGMRSDGKQDECGSVENHPQPMATNAQPDSHSNTPSTSEMTSGHPVKPGLGSEHTCRQNQCGAVGNHPHLMTVDVPPDSMTHDSVPPPALAIYTALRTGLDELVRMRVEGADVDDLQKAETQAVEDIINLIQVIPQSHGRGFGEETDAALGLMISSSPDLLRDLLKQEPLRSGKTSPAEEEGEPLHEETPPSDVTQIQSRLLQVLQSVSSSQDPAMLRDVIGTLSSILGGAPHEDRPHSLEILQEESSSDEAEGAVADPMEAPDLCQSTEVETISDTGNAEAVQSKVRQQYSTQDYLECVGRLQDHADVLEEIMNVLSSQQGSLSNNMEELHSHLDESQAQLKSTYQDLLSTLDRLSGCIHDNSEMACNLDILNPSDVDTVKDMIQKNKGMETNLSGTHRHLEDTAFDIQYFISEHAQFLSPTQSRHLLKSLSATQREFKEQMERVAKQRRTLERHLEIREDESQQKYMEEKQKVFSDKLQELCDNLTNTENRLIGHQQQTKGAASVEDLQHVQQEHQALQKDILTNGSALNEVISSSKKFLDENRSKLTPDQIIAIESKLEDAKSKVKLINQRAEEARKDLEKSVTTAIKQETEKEAAVEQLEESKNKIEGLLDWINNMGNEKVMGGEQTDHMGIQNGNMPLQSETSAKNILGEDDDPNGNNGNAFQTTDNDTEGQATGKTPELDLEKQYDRVKARHQEILSQQQELIMATQSAQALLDHQAHALSPTDKDKLQRDIQELKGRYDSSLTQAEQQMKQMVQVQEELKKFQGDCEEFEGWLQQAEGEVEELGAPAGALNDLTEKLRRQKSFSDDVISHKGDLRFITISGQKVLDVAKACGRMDPGGKDAQLEVDTTATCAAVKEKLDSAAGRFKALHSQCNDLGNNLRDVVDKYKKYEDSAAGLLKWLNNSEEDARRQQSEAIAADPQTLQKQLEDTKGLQGQTTGRQTAVETLRKTADSLVTAQGDLLTNQDHIHETVDDIVERYDNLSKSVSDRNEKLQITLTRSLSVQDGLDEMMSWMEGVEESVKEKGQVPLDSAVIGDVLSKEAALEQDISSRQSSISAMKAKVKKFVETADPAAAALLQSKMDALSQRFSDACDKHKHKQGQLEQLKDKVEEFEKTTEKVQQFVLKRSQALSETDGPGKNVNELSQLMQDTNTELAEHAKDVEMLQMLSKELANMGPEGSKAQIQSKMDKLSDTFNTFKNTVKEKEEEVTSCQDQLGDFRAAAGALRTWLEETTEKVPVVQPTSSEQSLGKDLQRVNALMEEWTTKGSAVQDINSKGSALCSLISVLTSPAKTKMSHKSAVTNSDGPGNHAYLTNKELMVVQQNMSYINEGHKSLGEVLKGRATELSVLVQEVTEAQKETDTMITWLQDMKKTAASWNSASTEKDTMKTQLEQQKAFEEDMKQKHEQLQKLREKLLHLIEKHPDSPEAEKWKQMLSQIDTAWADVSGSVEDRKQRLEESNRNLDVFQTTEPQLRQWLSEKDMMLSVLGPLSMDPNMLNTQKQQVQILLNEFDSRKPQFDQLHEAAAAILSTSGKQDPSSGGKVVKDQLAAVTQKWQGLTGQLGQRAGLIDQAVGKSSQFQDLLMSLSQSAASLETRLNSQQALSSQPDVVKKQLEEANTISGQLREERKRLKEAETLCSELSALVTEDYLKAGLDRQLEGVNKPFKQLEDKAGKRIQQLNSAFASSQQFHQASKDFQGWMNGKLQEQSKLQAISAQVETLRQSLKEQSALQKALSEHEEPYSTIVREGETLLQNTDGAEKVAMQGQLATLRSNWDDVKKSSAERQDKLQGALQRAQKYHEHAEKLQSWVQECEVREGSVRLSVDPAEVESSISQLKAIQKDVDKHRGLVEQLNTAADSLLEVANADTEAVREEKAAIGQSVDRVTDGVQNKRESLEKISQRLKEFNDTHNEAKGQLAGAKKQLDAHTSLGVQAYSNKNLTNMKAQQKSLDGVNTQVEHLKSLAQGLVADVPEADGVTDLLLQADSLEKEHGSLSKDVGETCSTLEGKLQGIGQFQTNIREMFTRFADLDDELDSMASVGRDLITLKEQQDGIKGFVEKLQGLMADTARGGDSCKKMLETEASPDLLGLKRDLDGLSKQCGKLMDRAKGRGEEVGSTLTRLDELYSKLQQFTNKLGGAEVKEEGQGSVGMETDVINQQLEAFKVFQKEVDPLQSQLQDINWLGQGLIQNADKGTSTKGLEHDLEDVNTRWNTLNKKIAERSVQLHEALLHCGRFQDALESLLSWLTDTEDLVSNQKPPSAEFKVVKAQIQEQILLQRLLDDRRPTVELIKKEGGKVAELGAESVDKEKVGKEIDCLGQRWDALLKKAENRHKQLKSILVVAQQFHETLEPLSEWLSATEKHLAKAEPIGTQTSKLEEQISQHKALHEDIELRKQNVDQAISNGLELLKQTTGDEVVVIQGKLDGIKTRYAEINSMSGNVSQTLNQALTLASKLQHTHEDLSSWLENVEAELTAFAAQAPVGEQLVQAQDRQKALLQEARDHKPQVDKLNEVSSSLLELVPWRAREGLDKIVTEDNDRYKATSDTIAHHAEQIDAAILKSQQFEQAADTELAWLTEAERKMLSLGEIRLEQDQTTVQLLSQKGFSMDIMRHKDAVDGIVKTGEAIMNSKDEEEKQALKAKIQALLEKYVVVSQLNSERCLQLERAQSLASQFWETYEELWPWLQETRTSFSQLPLASIEYEALRQQQEELRQMRELIAEHKPYIDKMNKTGPQLLELSPVAGVAIREKYTATDLLYAQLKADVKQRAFTLDEAISKSTQFHDKIEPMLESLERIAERLHQPPSISVEVEKIREQITENKVVSADLEKLQPSYDTLKQRGEEMIARSAGADKDISAKAVQDKLDRMVFTWNEIHALMEEREAKLLDVMDLADKFWCDHCALIVTIKDTQDLLRELEEPGVDPSVVKQQQEYLESFKEEIDGLQEELDVVRNLGAELMAACGEPDKPVTKKSIDEVNLAWETLNKAWKERVDRLDEAMQAAVQFQDGLQGMFDWVDIVEHKLGSMSPVGTDLDTVKQQIEELKEFKGEAYQLQMEMERLNHQAGLLLKKVTEEYDRCAIQEPMTELKMLWDNLDEKIINRQHKLEGALLALGQFQHALDELLAWMSNTEELLNEQRKAVGDPKAIEIKLAKHHVLQNDVLAHKTTVEAVNKAGTDLVESTSGEEAAGLQNKLENLTQRWKNILEKTEQRRQQLDSALLQAQGFHGEMEDMQQWLKDTERQLLASKAVGGLPDTAREQLNAHLELCSTMEAKEELYQQLMNKGQQLLTMTPSGQDSNTEQDLRNLQDKWESVQAKVAERKVKLEEALALATEFHNSLQDFISWLTQAEQTLTMSSPASVILETILFQIDEHKVFVTEVNSHRQQIIELDKTGTHLKYFSQKQDVVLIKNLLISVQGRWEKVVQRSVERGRLLDDTRKRAKQFHETWNKLTEWLDDSEKALDSELEIANDPDKIKTQLAQHKEFQKVLGSKHSVYDTTSRTGRALKDKTSLQDDNQKLDDMLSELRDKWDTVCGKSVERQNKLEEALLFSGQFTDALQALIDWLYRVEPQLAEDQPVHGDIDLVLNLIDSHKVFQKELGKRTGSVAALKRSAKDLIESSHEDSSWVKAQMQELSARWETVCARSVSKQTRLEQALCQAEEFHSTVHMLLEWLAEAEQSLRFHGTLPDDEEALGALIEQHKEFMKKQEEKRVGLNKATSMGEAILTICHPDSITTIKHWNTIIKARFEEVQAWARQHQQRLAMALSDLLATKDLLEGLLGWLQWAETTLNDKDKEVIPQEIDEVKSLIAEHQTFMEEMTRKQPDVDKVTKTHKRKAVVGSEPASQSHIPVLEKGRGGRKRSPTQAMYPSSQPPIETKNPRVNLLVSKWQQVWLLALDRRRKLNDAMDRLEELKEFANFDFDVWRKRYMRWMNHKKSRVMDFFRRIDKDQDGKVTRQEFIEGILSSKFPTSRLEMSAVADIFDRDGDGYIDYYEFVAALHPNKEAYKPLTDADKIEDEVTRQVAKCKCPKRFQVEQIGANKYRFYLGNQFGDSQQLRLVRILRSTVMVRVGGGWMALDEFLVKNDPCRAKGRTNMELREKFILPEGTTQVMASFRYRGRRSRPSSRAASPNRSNSNHSCPAQHNNPALTSTPKTPQHITRNYDKPWLTNSKPSSPLKSSDSFESQGSSSESIPIQGSKLRLPGYLSGKGFQSGEEQGTLINAAVMKARGQAIGFESRRPGSRPGSKAGSRGSSRRGSDASDFDISDIASVCSETSEMVGDTSRATPRSSSRQHGGKPSKIPTPQRRLTPSKLAKTSKR
ncbi:dystonin isoform X10 [Oncorhynchus tshawytscha]|uniref:dystonin isoform X10 n=1 Tax=Oncorhynchus tshawytscha TaxID=74940 RepID=UPI000D0993D2|nr:dystonin isoform X10 [Oncorhynchus tshawytscha]